MSRKPKRGYYVKGHFVAEGSELDLQLKAELKGTDTLSKTDLKREMERLQNLGEDLLTLRADLYNNLPLPDVLRDALAEARRITNFEGRRRQMQYVGKLMRKLDDDAIQAAAAALEVQHQGSAEEKAALHLAEHWRDRLIDNDDTLTEWLALEREAGLETDLQHLRALIRQARKDQQAQPPESQGAAQRHGKPYRELFQIVKAGLKAHANASPQS